MTRNKNYTPLIVIVIIIVGIICYLFMTVKQESVRCSNTYRYDYVTVNEDLLTNFSGNKIESMTITKTILLDGRFADPKHVNQIKNALDKTLSYLDDVKYTTTDNKIVVTINAKKNEIVLLGNIEFITNDDLEVKINSNTKSTDVITLTVGENYTESDLMTKMKNNGYSCH